MATFLSVILLDVDLGLIVGICVSILVIVIRLVVLVMIFIEIILLQPFHRNESFYLKGQCLQYWVLCHRLRFM